MGGRSGWAVSIALAAAMGCGSGGSSEQPVSDGAPDGSTSPAAPAPPPEGPVPGGDVAPPTAVPTVRPGLRVLLKLDASLTMGLYMGERWVAPATFTALKHGEAVLEARAQHVDADHNARDVSVTWAAEDPQTVAVSSREGHRVELRVLRAGQTTVRVEQGGQRVVLAIAAREDGGAWWVEVTQ
jgi:hypothetical protein